jgi:2-desacetyl-2-hydroxyethyl bacteriochlorophyllide A dehydrogenase
MTNPSLTAAVINGNRELAVEQLPIQELGHDEVRVHVAFCGLCGSDLHLFFGPPEPFEGHVLGHEFSGTIGEVGAHVTGWRAGDRVAIRPIDACGDCAACRDEDGVCISGLMRGPGLGRAGGLAASVTVPAQMLHRVPDGLSLRDAALAEPLAVAVRGVRRGRVSEDAAVIVMGAGPIGLLTLEVLRARGISRVLIVEPNPERRAAVAPAGIATAHPSDMASAAAQHFPQGIDAVFDCSGQPGCAQEACNVVGYGGRVVILGVPEAPSEVHMMTVAVNELSIIGSTAHSRREFDEALDLLASGRIDTARLISSVVGLAETDAKLRELASGESKDVKVLVRHGQ